MSQSRFALLIGVSDYRAFDQSADHAPGSSDLFGPPNNLASLWEICLSLGFTAADIGLLASPLPAPQGGRPALYTTATRASVLDGVRTLALRIAAAQETQALIYFTGHGDEIPGVGPVLCLEDTVLAKGELDQVVSLAEIAAILEELAPNRPVTVVLDSCDSGTPDHLLNRRLGLLQTIARTRDHDTLLSATAARQRGVELLIDGKWQGAFTWALSAALSPYRRLQTNGFLTPDLSLDRLIDRSRDLLRGASIRQQPQLLGEGPQVLLQPGGVPFVQATNRLAHQRRGWIEIYGDQTGHVYEGDEAIWVGFDLESTANPPTALGQFFSSYNTSSSVIRPYSDFWAWNSGWPGDFTMTFNAVWTEGVDDPPSSLPTAKDMMAFNKNLPQSAFGSISTSGYDQLWGVAETSTPGSFLMYFLRNATTGQTRWLVTWPGYSERGQVLTALPANSGTGGVELDDNGGTLWFFRLTTIPSSLASVVSAYNVYEAAQ